MFWIITYETQLPVKFQAQSKATSVIKLSRSKGPFT